MSLFSKHKQLPIFKVGEKVCFLLQMGQDGMGKTWCMGEIAGFPVVKLSEEALVDVWVYEIPDSLVPKKRNDDEWSSLDPLPFALPSEVIIMSRLSSRTTIVEKKSAKTKRLLLKDVCKATVNDFRTAFTQCSVYPSRGKQIFG